MDIGQIVIAAIGGGLGAGIGAGIGAFVGQRFSENTRRIVLVICAVLGFSLGELVADQFKNRPSRADIETELLEKSELNRLFKTHYPDDWDQYLQSVTSVRSTAKARELSQNFTMTLRRREADNARKATPDAMTTYLNAYADLMVTVSGKGGDQECGDFFILGTPPDMDDPETVEGLNVLATSVFRALVSGKNSDVSPRSSATTEDWQALSSELIDNGMTVAEIDLVGNPADKPIDGFCVAVEKFMRGMADFDGESGDRLKTELLFAAASG
ncbi:MAG: hypothetical protein CMK07_10430 [Ponticaulis sp.]|mgnify:CR=1 FL=1|nr:hypothetical protein [Ponticaulis sp.]